MTRRNPNEPGRPERSLFLSFMLGVLALTGAVRAQVQPAAGTAGSSPAVGHTKNGPVRCSELRSFVDQAPRKVRRRPAAEPEEQWRQRMVEKLVLIRQLAAEGLAAGGDGDPELLERWNRIRDRLVLGALERDLSSGIEVRREEIERHYQENRQRFASPEKITTQLILLRLPPDADPGAVEAATERLRSLRAQHLAGTQFGELARRHSQAENAGRGGIVAASPRGSLLAEFEDAAWKLKPGEVSDVVRLPDGVALIMLNKRLAARRRSLDDARAGIEKRLRHEKARRQRDQALTQVCSPWPPEIGGGELAATMPRLPASGGTVLLHLAGEAVRLQDLDVDRHRPRWREEVAGRLTELCQRRLATDLGIDKRPEIAGKLRFQRSSLLASYAMDRRLEASPPAVPEEQLKALYEQHRNRFEIPEQRTFEAVVVAGGEGRLRPARAQAQAVAQRWRDTGNPGPPDARSQELWGPLPQTALAALTSPILARQAFALEPGEISEPLRLERYEIERSRFETEGYVVLGLRLAEPATFQPFEQARERVLRYAARDQLEQLSDQIRREILFEAELRIDREALAACQLAVPPAGPAAAAGDPSPSVGPGSGLLHLVRLTQGILTLSAPPPWLGP